MKEYQKQPAHVQKLKCWGYCKFWDTCPRRSIGLVMDHDMTVGNCSTYMDKASWIKDNKNDA